MKTTPLAAAIAAAGVMAAAGAYSADAAPYPERVLWGDEHVHTGWSADAGLGAPPSVRRTPCASRSAKR